MKNKLKILIIGMSPVIIRRMRLNGIPLAPLALKSYADHRLNEENPGCAQIDIKVFFLEDISTPDIAVAILNEEPDIVAFSVYIWNYYEVIECVNIIKNSGKNIKIICGGPQMSPVAEDMMAEHEGIDIIPYITIPGEIIFYDLVKALIENRSLDQVEGIVYKNESNEIVKTATLSKKFDYSKAPSPYLDGTFSLDTETEKDYVVSLETSRGCPYDCGYCFYGRDTNRVHYFDIEKILNEIEVVYNHPNIKYVFFSDSDIFLNKKRAEKIVKHIIKQKSEVISEFDINAVQITEPVVKLLAQLPHYRFCFAIQTVNPKALNCLGKSRPKAEFFIEKIKLFKQWVPNAEFHVDIMLGLPEDDFSWFKKTLDVCLSMGTTRIGLNYPLFLLPGTRFFAQREKLGIRYSEKHPISLIETKTFPEKDIVKALKFFLWVEVLTYYYSAIGKYFYRISKGDPDGAYIERIDRWISSIEQNVTCIKECDRILDIVSTGSVKKWGELKGGLLRSLATAENAYGIYSAVQQQERHNKKNVQADIISTGVIVFDFIRSKGIEYFDPMDCDKLPKEMIQNLSPNDVASLFSRYK